MLFAILAILCTGVFAGAAIYITAVEHPARLACGPTIAVKAFASSYHRAAVMQASLAVVGCVAGVTAWMHSGNGWLLTGALLLGSVVPFTLLVIWPTNKATPGPRVRCRDTRSGGLARTLGVAPCRAQPGQYGRLRAVAPGARCEVSGARLEVGAMAAAEGGCPSLPTWRGAVIRRRLYGNC